MISPDQMIANGISPGVTLGSALVLKSIMIHFESLSKTTTDAEIQRFEKALEKTKIKLEKLYKTTQEKFGKESADIFEAHMLILEDPELKDVTIEKIRKENFTAEYSLTQVSDEIIKTIENINDDYLRERANDIKDIRSQILANLSNQKQIDLSEISKPVILVAHDITPSQMGSLNKEMVLGFITEIGGKTSHTAILAKNMEIPAVSGVKEATIRIKTDDKIFLNGHTGEVLLHPSEEKQAQFLIEKEREKTERDHLFFFKEKESKTKDGQKFFIEANIGSPQDISLIEKYGAEGVGLFRTEFVFMDRVKAPTENEQFEIYKMVLAANPKHNVIIRTLDIGGDKEIPYLKIEKEMNPFLGLRAIRYCLKNQNLFKTQLRALLRASIYGHLGIMIPMISNREEVRECRSIISQCHRELINQGISVSDNYKIGIMIETPSAAVIADTLAKEVDFFSLGTNDLIQYVCAVDRLNEKVQNLYEPYHPAVLRLIHQTIVAAKQSRIQVGICGDLAAHQGLLPALVGFGVDHLSMSPSSILKTRALLASLNFENCKILAHQILNLGSADEIRTICEKMRTVNLNIQT